MWSLLFSLSFFHSCPISLFKFSSLNWRARAYSPTKGALWLRIQTLLNRANIHTKETALQRGKGLGLIVIRLLILQDWVAAHQKPPGSRDNGNLLASLFRYPIVRSGYRSVILVNMSLSCLNHDPTQPSASFFGDASMPNHAARSMRRRHKTRVTANPLAERKPVYVADFAFHEHRSALGRC